MFNYVCLHKKSWLWVVKYMHKTTQRKHHMLSDSVITKNTIWREKQNYHMFHSFALCYIFF
jgi:hypothetical protein